jgi:hypothetical protein
MQARDIVNEIVDNGLAQLMRAHGFRKSALTFRRTRGETTQFVSLQLSHGNFGNDGGFYVNIGIAFNAITALEGTKTVAALVGGDRVHFFKRLEQLEASAPETWKVTAATNTVAAGEQLCALTAPILMKLESITTPASMLAAFPLDASVLRAQLHFLNGDRHSALEDVRTVAEMFVDRRGMSVSEILARHGMNALAESS